eukprot:TRINITY_DN34430_c0_g1_i1.p1 TRINITY_DN34430_c0_g1~~TRINITY_DN34430_c0_g1_i1.p1  ORF type:complete len:400 (+),score=36.94 TRINITY_DN34430_c0_g1_i1:38-1237(+)
MVLSAKRLYVRRKLEKVMGTYLRIWEAIKKMRVRTRIPLRPQETELMKAVFNATPAVSNIPGVLKLLRVMGQTVAESEIDSLLHNLGYKVGIPMSLGQLTRLMQTLKFRHFSSILPDTVEAFAALGGGRDKNGSVDVRKLKGTIADFELTIDIDAMVIEADRDGSGILEYEEFSAMFNSTSSPSKLKPSDSQMLGRRRSKALRPINTSLTGHHLPSSLPSDGNRDSAPTSHTTSERHWTAPVLHTVGISNSPRHALPVRPKTTGGIKKPKLKLERPVPTCPSPVVLRTALRAKVPRHDPGEVEGAGRQHHGPCKMTDLSYVNCLASTPSFLVPVHVEMVKRKYRHAMMSIKRPTKLSPATTSLARHVLGLLTQQDAQQQHCYTRAASAPPITTVLPTCV